MKKLNVLPVTIITAALSFASAQSTAQTAPVPAPARQAKQPCSAPEHRQFDFWIGDWDVFTPDGNPAGTNLIRLLFGQCGLHENWTGTGGSNGQSANVWDARRKLWHQTWVDAAGGVLMLDGKFENGSMTLSDRNLAGKPDAQAINEIAWTPNADGSVRQHWRVSKDGGNTWTKVFDGIYRKSRRPQPNP